MLFLPLVGNGEQPWMAEVDFGEMADISEAMIIGFPTLTAWGMCPYYDAHGNLLVEFRALGITMMAETPATRKAAKLVTCESHHHIKADSTVNVPIKVDPSVWADANREPWILNVGIPCVDVVQGPLSQFVDPSDNRGGLILNVKSEDFHLNANEPPWEIGYPQHLDLLMYEKGKKEGLKIARDISKQDRENECGFYESDRKEAIFAVKLT